MTGPDIDEVAVERAIKGDHGVALNRDEMAEALHQLEARGLPLHEIAARLGVSVRSVNRWRSGEHAPARRPGRSTAA